MMFQPKKFVVEEKSNSKQSIASQKSAGKPHRRAIYRAVVLMGIMVASLHLAFATIWFPAPPSCHRGGSWIQWKPYNWAYYGYAYQYRKRVAGPPYNGVYPTRLYYVYDVQNLFYPYGMVTIGRAERDCGP